MQQKRTRSSRPKVFQCTGFGDCKMIFTRSEHLARHSRKHTGEKPFVCIVPLCTKAFSRFDNMMQHTQTHRNNSYNIISPNTRSTRASLQRHHHKEEESCQKNLRIDTATAAAATTSCSGLISPVSLSSPKHIIQESIGSTGSYSSSDEEDDDESTHMMSPLPSRRRLSIAELCNPTTTCVFLTKDEFEALEGFDQFRHSPTVFF
ncbi:hypothetical protein MFLAVUS_006731 [Mucor flavus]|uniref:C2H2-type domain-containing protein n=1 Tax=Mucor flavus TaxID=439312 RepID=A0ABP9Z2C7_9FUNG